MRLLRIEVEHGQAAPTSTSFGGAGFSVWGYTGDVEKTNIYGTVNSLNSPSSEQPATLTPVPEPASALVFFVLGAAFVGYRRVTPRTPKVPST